MLFEYTKIKDRYLEFEKPTGGYHTLEHHSGDTTLFIEEEIDEKFLVINIFDKKIGHFVKIISNVELELKQDNPIPNMDTYIIKA